MEKSNVNKLEKAELLQMAVDHLKIIQNNPDYSRSTTEHQNAGFRECMGEVSRYLVAVEGMHIEEPLRLRLMSHLHAFSTARAGSQLWIGQHYGGPYEDPPYDLPVPPTFSMDRNVRDKSYQQHHPHTTRPDLPHQHTRPCYSDRSLAHHRHWGLESGGSYS